VDERAPRRENRIVKSPKWLPGPASWASAVALFVFGIGVSVVFAFVLPLLAELMRHSPRLAWLGMLAMWLSPIAVAAGIHRLAGGALEFADTKRVSRGSSWAESAWSGFVAWGAVIVVSTTTSLLMLVLDPPPVDPDAAWRGALDLAFVIAHRGEGILRAVVWIALAAYVYELERAARA
jgi:hypothetical protein